MSGGSKARAFITGMVTAPVVAGVMLIAAPAAQAAPISNIKECGPFVSGVILVPVPVPVPVGGGCGGGGGCGCGGGGNPYYGGGPWLPRGGPGIGFNLNGGFNYPGPY
jgi:hypothetical protein